MPKIWLKGVSFEITKEQFEVMHGDNSSLKEPGRPMKEDEAFELVMEWYPEMEELTKERIEIAKKEQELRILKAKKAGGLPGEREKGKQKTK